VRNIGKDLNMGFKHSGGILFVQKKRNGRREDVSWKAKYIGDIYTKKQIVEMYGETKRELAVLKLKYDKLIDEFLEDFNKFVCGRINNDQLREKWEARSLLRRFFG